MRVVELTGVVKRFGEVIAVDTVSFHVDKGQIISLLGPSGCGKTTTLRLIAGFETPDGGTVRIDGEDMRGKRPYERNVGLLFQDYALFPHMTVEQNVAYGLKHRGFARAEIPKRTRDMLSLVKLTGLEARRPSQLSGGQQERVALARALATEPAVMLLDEPLSALDAKLRQELRVELKEILTQVGSTTIVVTHDQEEAMSLAEHVIVMDLGRIMQQGPPTEIYTKPANKFVAEFVGRSNWFQGQLGGAAAHGIREFRTVEGLVLRVAVASANQATRHEVCVRPERMKITRGPLPDRSGQGDNAIPGTIADVAHLGADIHRFVTLSDNRRVAVIEKHLGQPLGRSGDSVVVTFAPEDCIVVAVEG